MPGKHPGAPRSLSKFADDIYLRFSHCPAQLHPPPSPFSSERCITFNFLFFFLLLSCTVLTGYSEMIKRLPTALSPHYPKLSLGNTQGHMGYANHAMPGIPVCCMERQGQIHHSLDPDSCLPIKLKLMQSSPNGKMRCRVTEQPVSDQYIWHSSFVGSILC